MTLAERPPAGQTSPSPRLERVVRAEIAEAEDPQRPIRRRLRRVRAWVAEHPRLEIAYRAAVAVVGIAMALGGLILVPLPGPGWLVVFLGLAVLGTEFHWARRITAWLKRMLDRFWTRWRARHGRAQATAVAAGARAEMKDAA